MITQQTAQFKLCTGDYITTMCPAWAQFLFPENLLTNPDILECILWEWSGKIFLLLTSNPVTLKCKLWEWYEVKWKSLSHVPFFATPWTIQSMEFSRPEHWSGWPFSSPGDLPTPGIEPRFSTLQVNSLPAEPQGKPLWKIWS